MRAFHCGAVVVGILSVASLVGSAATTSGELQLRTPADNPTFTVSPQLLQRVPLVRYQPGTRLQAVSYTVIDSLFNAFSYYGSNQTCVVWEPRTKTFFTIKRGALPPTATNTTDISNNIFVLYTTNNGQSWTRVGPVIAGTTNPTKYPRYPALAFLPGDPANPTLDNSAVGYYSPFTDGNSFVGLFAGFIPLAPGAAPTNTELTSYPLTVNGQTYNLGYGTTINTASYTRGGDSLYAFGMVSVFPSPSGSAPTSENNNLAIVTITPSLGDIFAPSIPSSLRSTNFVDPGSPDSRTSTEVGLDVDQRNNLYAGVFGRFLGFPNVDSGKTTFGVTKSTDNGLTWSPLNVLPTSVIEAYAQQNGGDPASSGFGFSWGWAGSSTGRVTAAKDFAVTGEDSYSFAAQFILVQGNQIIGAHYVEVYYENGQWGIRKIADASLFETSSVWGFNTGDASGPTPSQLGCELQLSRTSDYSALLFKTLEARLVVIDGDTLLTTDVVASARPKVSSSWDVLRNVTQSLMLDRITWIPHVIPDGAENVPLLTVQSANRGSSDRDYYWANQFLLASGSTTPTEDEVLRYRQYVTYSLFTYEGLPTWSSVEEQAPAASSLVLTPNPAQQVVTVAVSNIRGAVTIELVSMLGQVVYRAELPAGSETIFHTIDTAQFPAGAYQCVIRTADGVRTAPLRIVR